MTPKKPNQKKSIEDAAKMLWAVLANVSGYDWSKQSTEWQEAAARNHLHLIRTVLERERTIGMEVGFKEGLEQKKDICDNVRADNSCRRARIGHET